MKSIALFFCLLLGATAMQAQVIHVPADFDSIQEAIVAANPGDTVLVAEGTYYEQIDFLGIKPLMVASHFLLDGDTAHISRTVIDGSHATDPNNSSVVNMLSGEDTTSTLCGFMITGGRGSFNEQYNTLEGGGIRIINSGARIMNNIIRHNHLDDSLMVLSVGTAGAGLVALDSAEGSSVVIIENNEISNNTSKSYYTWAVGGGLETYCGARISGNKVFQNLCIGASDSTGTAGGGISCISDPFPPENIELINNQIVDNTITTSGAASNFGAGVDFETVNFICQGNIFSHNQNLSFGQDVTYGGGLFCWNTTNGSRITNNEFSNNFCEDKGGAISLPSVQGRPMVENNYFFNNSAELGGAIHGGYSKFTLQNNVFYSNDASGAGGAVFLEGNIIPGQHYVYMVNNSFHKNSAHSGGAIYTLAITPLIMNCIFWEDSASIGPEIRILSQFVELAYCNIDTNDIYYMPPDHLILGEGLMNADPIFLDTLLTIDETSPCMDAGVAERTCHNTIWEAPTYDIRNYMRPWIGGYDMGAYEFGSFGVGGEEKAITHNAIRITNYPNPFSGSTMIAYALEEESLVRIQVFNSFGQLVAEPANGTQPAGKQEVRWDSGSLPAGMYFYRIDASGLVGTGKLIKL